MTPKGATALHLTAHVRRDESDQLRLYLVPELQESAFLNAHALIQQLDALDANLAPSLLALMDRAHHLTPLYTPADAYETVVNLHWQGDDTGEEALEDLRYEMAQERGVTPNEIPIEEAQAIADDQFLTPSALEERLPRRYYEANTHTIQTPEILERLNTGLFPNALGDLQHLIKTATTANEHAKNIHQHTLSDWDDVYLYENCDQWYTTIVSITDPALMLGPDGNEFADVVYEMLYELDNYNMQAGNEPGPSGAFLIPHTPEGMQHLAHLTKTIRKQLALEARTYNLFKNLTQAAANAAERSLPK